MTTVLAGQRAPQFTLTDVRGQRRSLAEALREGPIVAAFFKVSCPVCQFTFPFLERLHQNYGDRGVNVWGISQDDAADTKEFWNEYDLSFPALLDAEGYPVSNQYGLTNVPTVLLIAPDGKVSVSFNGFSKADLERISVELGRHHNVSPSPVFYPHEYVPDYKPG